MAIGERWERNVYLYACAMDRVRFDKREHEQRATTMAAVLLTSYGHSNESVRRRKGIHSKVLTSHNQIHDHVGIETFEGGTAVQHKQY